MTMAFFEIWEEDKRIELILVVMMSLQNAIQVDELEVDCLWDCRRYDVAASHLRTTSWLGRCRASIQEMQFMIKNEVERLSKKRG